MSPSIENTVRNGDANSNGNGEIKYANSVSTAYGPGTFDLSKVLEVRRSPKAYSSYAVSLVDLPAGSVFAPILGITSGTKAYSSVQVGPDSHIELNSELLYCNHSCDPTVEFDVTDMVVRVSRTRDLKAGDVVTFWYPSTEWSMAQRFECGCGTQRCKGWISGAGEMNEAAVREYWLNKHIVKLLDDKSKARGNGHPSESSA